MNHPFDASQGLVFVGAKLDGPRRRVDLRLAVDTACHQTVINPQALYTAGYGNADVIDGGMITTASGTVPVRRIRVSRLLALGHESDDVLVVAHQVPSRVPYDGLLGLDFLRGRVLTVDFVRGLVSLA